MSDTPRTDAKALEPFEYYRLPDEDGVTKHVAALDYEAMRDHARALERQNAELLEALQEAIEIFRGFRAGCSECDDEGRELDWRDIDKRCLAAVNMLRAAITKTEPK